VHQLAVVERVDDDAIRNRISLEYARSNYVLSPHTATAVEAWERLDLARQAERILIAAATAHPYKFADVVADQRNADAATRACGDPGARRPRQLHPGNARSAAGALAGEGRAAEAA
jgi:threonine synthase